jgi:hypothetical protein
MVEIADAAKLRKPALLRCYTEALEEIAHLREAISNLQTPKARPVLQPVEGLIKVAPFAPVQCPEHGNSRANKLGHCFHCYNRAKGKPAAH